MLLGYSIRPAYIMMKCFSSLCSFLNSNEYENASAKFKKLSRENLRNYCSSLWF